MEYIISKAGNHRMLSVQGREFITTYRTEAEAATRFKMELEKARERGWNVKAIVKTAYSYGEVELADKKARKKVPARVRVLGHTIPLE